MQQAVALPASTFPHDPLKLERLRALMREHHGLVERRCRRLGVPDSDLDDAVQDVFVVAARRLDDVEVTRERAFLLGTVARVASMRKRTRRRHPEDPTEALEEHPGLASNPEEQGSALVADRLVRDLLARLRSESRTVLLLAELEELPLRDVAERLGIPLGTVNSRLRRARAELRSAVVRMQAGERFVLATSGGRSTPRIHAPSALALLR